MGRRSKRKGGRGEREWRDVLRAVGYDAIRGRQNSGGPDSPDVKTELDGTVHFEVKRTEKLVLWPSLEQAVNDAGQAMPIVAHRPNRREWICILRAEDLLRLLTKVFPPERREEEPCTD